MAFARRTVAESVGLNHRLLFVELGAATPPNRSAVSILDSHMVFCQMHRSMCSQVRLSFAKTPSACKINNIALARGYVRGTLV